MRAEIYPAFWLTTPDWWVCSQRVCWRGSHEQAGPTGVYGNLYPTKGRRLGDSGGAAWEDQMIAGPSEGASLTLYSFHWWGSSPVSIIGKMGVVCR